MSMYKTSSNSTLSRKTIACLFACLVATAGAPALAQGSATPAKQLFGAVTAPSAGQSAALGSYAKGCLAGAAALAETGPTWQAMRLSRQRNWGHPHMIAFIERLGEQALGLGWPRILVGDISQPRGGPMATGHASHQIGLDVDIWLLKPDTPLLSRDAREKISAINQVAVDRKRIATHWTDSHARLLRAAASDGEVERIFVNAAIKTELCRWAPPGEREWLRKIRPWWGHDHHFHVRLACPADSAECQPQDAMPPGDGCDESLAWWLSDEALNPPPPKVPPKPKPPLTMADLPAACEAVVSAP